MVERTRRWDPPAALLLALALLFAAGRLTATEWVDHLGIVWPLTVLGLLSGLALGKSRFPPSLSTLLGLTYGLFFLLRQIGLALEPDLLWAERLSHLLARLAVNVALVVLQQPVRDPLLFLTLVGGLAWFFSLRAGHTLVRRGDPWRALVPSGLALLVVQTSDPYRPGGGWYLSFYLFFALLLVARTTYLRQRNKWEKERSHIPPLVGLDLGYAHFIVTALVIILAWATPATLDALPAARAAWQKVAGPWGTPARERMEDLFASLRGRTAAVVVSDYYGERLALGEGGERSDLAILTVQAAPPVPRYYWRVRVYDEYAAGEWSGAAYSITHVLDPATPITYPHLEGRREVTLTFTPAVPVSTLYLAPQPLWVDRMVEGRLAWNQDGSADLADLRVLPYLDAGKVYRVRASIAVPTVAQLRAASTDYPSWVTRRYLQLPPTVTPRTRALAREIASGLDTPYDVAEGVTRYLRTNISYRETVPPAPAGQEPLDWFLFDGREGFCNYYASAEVILLRSLGIPARLAVGFAQGERLAGSDAYLVRQRDAHAWPEVYFPGVGWVEFEPTASQALLLRPLGEGGAPEGPTGPAGERGERDRLEELLALEEREGYTSPPGLGGSGRPEFPPYLYLLLGGLALLVIWLAWHRRGAGPFPVLVERMVEWMGLRSPTFLRRWVRRAALSPMELAYLEVNRALRLLGAPPAPSDTPAERAAALVELLPEAEGWVQRLLAEYHASAYALRGGNLLAAREAGRYIRWMAWKKAARRLCGLVRSH